MCYLLKRYIGVIVNFYIVIVFLIDMVFLSKVLIFNLYKVFVGFCFKFGKYIFDG